MFLELMNHDLKSDIELEREIKWSKQSENNIIAMWKWIISNNVRNVYIDINTYLYHVLMIVWW